MARAAAKGKKRTRQAARPQSAPATASVKRDKALEDQLFFGRLRGHAKWAFVLLAVVFACSFVFLGVGSGGGAGLGDVFSNIFSGGSSGPNIADLQEKVAKNPKAAAAYLQLGQALEGKQRLNEAINAYEHYATLRPNNVQGLSRLGAAYEQKSQADVAEIQAAAADAQAASPGQIFGSGGSTLGQAIGSGNNPLTKPASDQANTRYQSAVTAYQATRAALLSVYQKIAGLSPNEPSAQLQVAAAAEQAGENATALKVYRSFVKQYPDDPSAAAVRQKIKELEKSSSAGASGQAQAG